MKWLIIFAIIAVVKGNRNWSDVYPLDIEPFGLHESHHPKIVGGQEAVPHAYPYQAALFLQVGSKTGFCGGSIISDIYILTAAHCLSRASSAEIIVGAHKVNENESTQQRFVSKDFIIHRGFNPMFITSDVALIKLSESIQFNDAVQPIRLPRYSDVNKSLNKKSAIVSGWGKDSDRATAISPVLRFVESHVISQFICQIYYFGIPGNNHVCISGLSGKSACNGDSGGPLTTVEEDGKITQQGLVSFGLALGCEIGWPSVFTKVAAFLPWIHTNSGISIRD